MKRMYLMLSCASMWLLWGSAPANAFRVLSTNPAFGKKSVRWAKQPVTIYVHQDGAPEINDGSDIRALKDAFQIWEKPTCNNLKFDVQLTTITVFSGDRSDPEDPLSAFQKDGKSVVRFESTKWNHGDQVIAQNATFFTPETGELEETDLLFNAVNFKWSTNEKPGTLDIITVAMARIGQMIGLWNSEVDNAVMGANFDLRGIDRTLRQDDIDGSCFLYNVNGWTGAPPPEPREPGDPRPEPPPPTETTTTNEVPTPLDGGNNPQDQGTTNPPTGNTGCQFSQGSASFMGFLLACLILLSVSRRRKVSRHQA